jgi:hypothetical protein
MARGANAIDAGERRDDEMAGCMSAAIRDGFSKFSN